MAGSRSGVPSLSVIKATPLIVHTRIYMRGRGDRRLQINAPDVWRRSCCHLPPDWRKEENPISHDYAAECKPDNWQKSEREKPDTAPCRGKEATIKNSKMSVVTLENKPLAHSSTGKKWSFLEVPTRKPHTDYCYKTDTTRSSNHQNGRAAGCDESCYPKTHKLHHNNKESELFVDSHKVNRRHDMERYNATRERQRLCVWVPQI